MANEINATISTPAASLAAPLAVAVDPQEEEARNLYILFQSFRSSLAAQHDPDDVRDCLQVYDPFIATLKEKGAAEKTAEMRKWIETNPTLPRNRILSHVTHIAIQDKGLTRLPKEIGALYALRSLGVTHSSLTTLPEELVRLKNLHTLTLDSNSLQDVPDALIYAKSDTIRRHSEICRIKQARSKLGYQPILSDDQLALIAQFAQSPSLLAPLSKRWKAIVDGRLFPFFLSQYEQDPFIVALMQKIPSPPARVRALYERLMERVLGEGGFRRSGNFWNSGRCEAPYPTERPLSFSHMRARATWVASETAKTLTTFFTGCVVERLAAGAPKISAEKIKTDLEAALQQRKATVDEGHWRVWGPRGELADPLYIQAEKSIRQWMQEETNRNACARVETIQFYYRMGGAHIPVWLLEELRYFPGIKKLDASHINGLRSIPEHVFDLSALTDLDLSMNGLETLSPSIARLVNLNSLNLYNNSLRTLPVELNQLTRLTYLSVDSNHLESIPQELQESPIDVIRTNRQIREARTIPRAPPLVWVPEATLVEKPSMLPLIPVVEPKPAAAIEIEKSILEHLISCCSFLVQQIYLGISKLFAFLRIST